MYLALNFIYSIKTPANIFIYLICILGNEMIAVSQVQNIVSQDKQCIRHWYRSEIVSYLFIDKSLSSLVCLFVISFFLMITAFIQKKLFCWCIHCWLTQWTPGGIVHMHSLTSSGYGNIRESVSIPLFTQNVSSTITIILDTRVSIFIAMF